MKRNTQPIWCKGKTAPEKGISVTWTLGQSILGGDEFVEAITERFLKGQADRERPSINKIKTYQAKDVILAIITKEAGKSLKAISAGKGSLRQIAMELLCRIGGGDEGRGDRKIFGVGYTSVSQGRRRLQERLVKDRKLASLLKRIEGKCND